MEPRFNADFSNVRIHSNQESASLSNQLSARAFTHQNNIFFSRDQYQPGSSEGKQLLAHELTHTIQQGHAVQRTPLVSTTVSAPPLQRAWGFDIAEYIADKARLIPGFTMLTVVIGFNPITGESVDRSAGNMLKGAIEMIPVAGPAITDALNNHGVFSKVSTWAAPQFDTIKSIGSSIWQDIKSFIKNLSGRDLLSPGDAWERGKAIITNPIVQIKAFAIGLKNDIVTFVKDAILKPIAAFAKANAPNGYDLLCAVLGKDPISGELVTQTAENLIAPFLKLIGQEEVWENMKKSNAIGRAWAWFQKALGTVKGFVQELPALFLNAFKALEIMDIVLIPRAFSKLVGVFGGFAGRFISWAGTAVWNLLEIIFEAVSPQTLVYIKKTGAALKSILKNPRPFVGNLVNAAKLGFNNFADNFGGHLKNGLIDWLTGALDGVYIPKALNLAEMGKFALSVLGITWAQIRGKIVKVLGPSGEKIMQGLETGFDIVVALVTGGTEAAWELIKEKLNDLKNTVIGGIVSFVTDTIVKKAIPKLVSMFIPGAGFISAIMSIYDTIMVFVEKISKIIQVVTAFIDSIVTIASGDIMAAAKRVESILGRLLSLSVSFLAGFLGLGKITDKIKEVIEKVRISVDKAIDAAIAWIVEKAKGLFGKVKAGIADWWKKSLKLHATDGKSHEILFSGTDEKAVPVVKSDPKEVEVFLKEVEGRPEGKEKPALDHINSVRSLITTIKTEQKKPEAKRDGTAIETAFAAMVEPLEALLGSGEIATKDNPLEIDYPKPSWTKYPTIYIGPLSQERIPQPLLEAKSITKIRALLTKEDSKKEWLGRQEEIKSYKPSSSSQTLPNGQSHPGIAEKFQTAPNLVIELHSGSTKGGKKINDFFRPYGYRAKEENANDSMDGDHLVEMQLGGPNELENLWPLSASQNRSGGSLVKSMQVKLPGRSETISMDKLKNRSKLIPTYLVIKKHTI